MAQIKQEFYVGDKVRIREDVDYSPFGYMTDMKALRGRDAVITEVRSAGSSGWCYMIDIGRGYYWHASAFSRIAPDLPEFEGCALSDLFNLLE